MVIDRGITEFMPDNEKREMFFFFFLGNKLGKCKQGMQKIGNKHTKQSRCAIPTFSSN